MIRFNETYLFKIHALSNALDKVFDQTLRVHADLTLSQFILLLAISQHATLHQRAAAKFLRISPAAVNRQAELAKKRGLIEVKSDVKGRGEALTLTSKGEAAIESGIRVLEQHVFKIFENENKQTSLMQHLDMLLSSAEHVIKDADNVTKEDKNMNNDVPKARKLFRGDINEAVIKVQKMTGIEITPSWWNQHVGNNGTTESILDRFDKAYADEIAKRRKN